MSFKPPTAMASNREAPHRGTLAFMARVEERCQAGTAPRPAGPPRRVVATGCHRKGPGHVAVRCMDGDGHTHDLLFPDALWAHVRKEVP